MHGLADPLDEGPARQALVLGTEGHIVGRIGLEEGRLGPLHREGCAHAQCPEIGLGFAGIAAESEDPARTRQGEGVEKLEDRRLARPRMADEGHNASLRHDETDIRKRPALVYGAPEIGIAQSLQREGRGRRLLVGTGPGSTDRGPGATGPGTPRGGYGATGHGTIDRGPDAPRGGYGATRRGPGARCRRPWSLQESLSDAVGQESRATPGRFADARLEAHCARKGDGGRQAEALEHFPVFRKKGLGRSVANEESFVEHEDTTRAGGLAHVMGDVDDGHTFGIEPIHEIEHGLARGRIEHGRGLVEGDATRPHRQGPCDGQALLLARREKVGRTLALGLQPHNSQGLVDPAANFCPVDGEIAGTEGHVFFYYGGNYLIGRGLKDEHEGRTQGPGVGGIGGVETIDPDRAGIDMAKAVHQPEQTRFARSIAPDDGDVLTFVDAKTQSANRGPGAARPAEDGRIELDKAHGRRAPGPPPQDGRTQRTISPRVPAKSFGPVAGRIYRDRPALSSADRPGAAP